MSGSTEPSTEPSSGQRAGQRAGRDPDGVEWVAAADVVPEETTPGILVRRVWGVHGSPRALVVDIEPGTVYPGYEVHDGSPEEIYVVSGVFQDGRRDYPAGTFIHNPTGTKHFPQSAAGCTIFVFYPDG